MRSNNRFKQRYFEELEQDCQNGLAKESTTIQRKKAVNYFIRYLNHEKINLKTLNSLHIQGFLQHLSQKTINPDKALAPATIKQIYALTKSFYFRCYERKIVTEHPDIIFTKKLLRRYKLVERKLPKYIDQENMQTLLNNCPNKWKALLYFMYDTGARVSEVLNVKFEHINFNHKQVQIFEPKTMNFRITSLSDKTIKLLQDYYYQYRPKSRPQFKDFVFISQKQHRMTSRCVQYIIKKLSGRILGEQHVITPHYFRAACAVHLLESGVDIRQVQEIIGWKSLTVVQNYTRVTPQRQTQLKEQHHPSFKAEKGRQRLPAVENMSSDTLDNQLLRTLTENQQLYRSELAELKQIIKQEQAKREADQRVFQQERQTYQQEIKELRSSQQKLINLLTQKTS